jgi:hypothetical protein
MEWPKANTSRFLSLVDLVNDGRLHLRLLARQGLGPVGNRAMTHFRADPIRRETRHRDWDGAAESSRANGIR